MYLFSAALTTEVMFLELLGYMINTRLPCYIASAVKTGTLSHFITTLSLIPNMELGICTRSDVPPRPPSGQNLLPFWGAEPAVTLQLSATGVCPSGTEGHLWKSSPS